jgi:deazaflavin-dependent oxidoreductase (nitroreductase family)
MNRSPEPALPRWLKPMNKLFVALQRTGLRLGGMYLLTVPGRVSGKPRTTPLSLLTFHGQRYVLGGFPGADWVKNVRAAGGAGTLSCGRHREAVRLLEVPAEEARPVLRVFPVKFPGGVPIMRDAGMVQEGTPEEYEALAGRCPVFRIEPS